MKRPIVPVPGEFVTFSTLPPIDRELQGLDDIELEPEPIPRRPSRRQKKQTAKEYARGRRAQRKAAGMCGYGCGRRGYLIDGRKSTGIWSVGDHRGDGTEDRGSKNDY